jgi:hypothetical protein
VFWAMAQQIGAFMAGGYVAGRMRSRWHESGHEADFRDGLHGGLVWAVGVVIGAALFLSTAGSVAKTGAEAAGGAATAASASASDPMDAVLDAMLRPTTVAQAGTPPAATPPPSQTTTARPRAAASADETRAEMSRLLSSAVATGSLSGESRAYLVQIVAQRAGIPQQEAERRVDQAFNGAREAADKARRAGILTGFVTAASLLFSLGAAWWAAMRGGNHRDHSIPARFAFGDARRRTINPVR